VGPTLVAMATKFELGAEIQSPTGLYSYLLTCPIVFDGLLLILACADDDGAQLFLCLP